MKGKQGEHDVRAKCTGDVVGRHVWLQPEDETIAVHDVADGMGAVSTLATAVGEPLDGSRREFEAPFLVLGNRPLRSLAVAVRTGVQHTKLALLHDQEEGVCAVHEIGCNPAHDL